MSSFLIPSIKKNKLGKEYNNIIACHFFNWWDLQSFVLWNQEKSFILATLLQLHAAHT